MEPPDPIDQLLDDIFSNDADRSQEAVKLLAQHFKLLSTNPQWQVFVAFCRRMAQHKAASAMGVVYSTADETAMQHSYGAGYITGLTDSIEAIQSVAARGLLLQQRDEAPRRERAMPFGLIRRGGL